MKNIISLIAFAFLIVGCIPDVERAEVQSSREEIIVNDQHNNPLGHTEAYKFM